MNKRKMKRYAEGDIVEGENPNIDDETRARARKFIEDNMESEPVSRFIPKSASRARTVSKKELEDSGLSLRDYMNKQQGLTRRGDSSSKSMNMIGKGRREDGPPVGNAKRDYEEAQIKKSTAKYETLYDRMNRSNRESGTDFDSMVGKLKSRITGASDRGQDRILTGMRKKADENKFMGSTGMKSGGKVSSASKRADGCAIKGKTRGKMI